MTSAPRSASSAPHQGPAMTRDRSSTRTPSRASGKVVMAATIPPPAPSSPGQARRSALAGVDLDPQPLGRAALDELSTHMGERRALAGERHGPIGFGEGHPAMVHVLGVEPDHGIPADEADKGGNEADAVVDGVVEVLAEVGGVQAIGGQSRLLRRLAQRRLPRGFSRLDPAAHLAPFPSEPAARTLEQQYLRRASLLPEQEDGDRPASNRDSR